MKIELVLLWPQSKDLILMGMSGKRDMHVLLEQQWMKMKSSSLIQKPPCEELKRRDKGKRPKRQDHQPLCLWSTCILIYSLLTCHTHIRSYSFSPTLSHSSCFQLLPPHHTLSQNLPLCQISFKHVMLTPLILNITNICINIHKINR